jgi:putative addiction module component (TIGR02574 family)
MGKTARALSDAARNLSPDERLELVDQILESLDEPNSELDVLWAKEADDRLAAYRRGDLQAIPMTEVLAKYPRR